MISAAGAESSMSSWRVMYLSSSLLVFCIVLVSCNPVASEAMGAHQTGPIKINISNPRIKTAIVHVVGTNETDNLDQDDLALPYCADNEYISVWAPGYYIGIIDCNGNPAFEYPIELIGLDIMDNRDWVAAAVCGECHSDTQGRTEYLEWNNDGHSRIFVDPYFWTMYMGTDVARNPDGLGFRFDNPGENGNCAYCHAPAVVQASEQGMDIIVWNSDLLGSGIPMATEGVTCDICHKVMDVLLANDLFPFADHPGVLSFNFGRLHSDQLFPPGLLLAHRPESSEITLTCAPVFSESKFCAACHYGKFFDTVVYNSYGEWLASPYSDKKNTNYRSCQDCHMLWHQPIEQTLSSEREACSPANLNFRDFNHNMMMHGLDPESSSQEIPLLIRDAATIGMDAIIDEGRIKVKVTVTNARAGHKFPTDSPLRHLILLVEARDDNEGPLAALEGPVIPSWAAKDLAGSSGVIYANLLKDRRTNTVPTFAYWRVTEPAWPNSDTRLAPGVPVPSEYSFSAPNNGGATITAKLLYRYAFFALAEQKRWNRPDIIVTSRTWECPRFKDPDDFHCEPKDE